MMRTHHVLFAVMLAGGSAAGGCASSRADEPPPATAQERPQGAVATPGMGHGGMGHATMSERMQGMCPMAVEGTTARAEDVEGGVAMVFTTTGEVEELRRRVAHMAQMHDAHHGRAGGTGMHGMMMGEDMPSASARTEDVDGGSRVVLTPQDPADLATLRELVRAHAEKMNAGECPMMSGSDAPAPEGHEGHHAPPPS